MFNQQELQVLLGGVNTPIDLEDLKRHTNYGGLFSDEEPTIRAFWRVSEALSCSCYSNIHGFIFFRRSSRVSTGNSVGRCFASSRASAVRPFCTQCLVINLIHTLIRVLISGFGGLVPKFCIRDAGGDENRLPTSSTCVNLLKVKKISHFLTWR